MDGDPVPSGSGEPRRQPAGRRGMFLFCAAVSACVAAGALGGAVALTSFSRMSRTFAPLALPGIAALLLLSLFPSMIAGTAKKRRIISICGFVIACWAIPSLAAPECATPWPGLALGGYTASLGAIAAVGWRENRTAPACFAHFKTMSTLAMLLAVCFALAGGIILAAGHLSLRLALTGRAVMALCLFAAATAGFGPAIPRLYPLLVYLSFLVIWLVVPVVGLEAYIYYGATDVEIPPFAVTGWKWIYGVCVPALVTAARLLQLGYKYIANCPPSPFATRDGMDKGRH